MPKIKTYTADLGSEKISGGRRATADDFGVNFTGVGAALKQVSAQIQDDAEQAESRKVLVEQAKIRQRYGKELEDAELSGADVDKIRERLGNELSQLSDGLQTQKGLAAAELHGANTLNVYDSAVHNLKVRRAGVEARTQGKDFIAAQSALLNQNPSYLPVAEQETDAFLATFKGRLPPEQIEEMARGLKQQANVAAVSRLAYLAPEDTKRRLDSGEFNLSPEQRVQETGRAVEQINAQRRDKVQARQDAEYERRKLGDEARDQWTKEILSGKSISLKDVVADQRMDAAQREHIAVFADAWSKRKLGEERKSDPRVVRDILLSIHAPEGDPGKVYNSDSTYAALKAGSLNVSDFRMLNNEVALSRDPSNTSVHQRFGQAARQIKSAFEGDPILKLFPKLTASAEIAWATEVRSRMDDERKANRNPARLFDAGHKDSVVSADFLAPFIADAKKQMGREAGTAAGAQIPTPKTKADYDAIPKGTLYLDTDGQRKVKN